MIINLIKRHRHFKAFFYFAKFKKKRGIYTKVSLREFYDFFKNMSNAQEENVIEDDSTEGNCIFEELDREISIGEI